MMISEVKCQKHHSLRTWDLCTHSSLSAVLSLELTARGVADIAHPRESSQAEATGAASGTK